MQVTTTNDKVTRALIRKKRECLQEIAEVERLIRESGHSYLFIWERRQLDEMKRYVREHAFLPKSYRKMLNKIRTGISS